MDDVISVEINQNKSYDIKLEDSFKPLKNFIDKKKRYHIITDSNVSKLYLEEFMTEVFGKKIDFYVFLAGESNKTYETVNTCYRSLLDGGHDRSTTLIALGGGVVGDITGFAASTFMRGIDYIQLPTTLLSMVDSSIGGKTGYDFEGAKNVIGSFYQPKLVYSNLSCLKTLSHNEFSSGMAECIKHGLIKDREYFSFIEKEKKALIDLDKKSILHLVKRSCEIKKEIVEKDEKETGSRELLNFGHTIGHAIEAASDYLLSHGESISIGINAAISSSGLEDKDKDRIVSLLASFDLPLYFKGSKKEILNFLQKDKKFKNGIYSFITLKRIGSAKRIKIKDFTEFSNMIDKIISIP